MTKLYRCGICDLASRATHETEVWAASSAEARRLAARAWALAHGAASGQAICYRAEPATRADAGIPIHAG